MLASILSAIGSVASIAGLILTFRTSDSPTTVKLLLILLFVLTAAASGVSYRYYLVTSEHAALRYQEERLVRRKEAAAAEAAQLLESFPTYLDTLKPGENEGIVYSGLAFLEKYKEVYPDSYQMLKENALADIGKAKAESLNYDYQRKMEQAASAMYRVVASIAGTQRNPRRAGGR